jgi:hypothetical protein
MGVDIANLKQEVVSVIVAMAGLVLVPPMKGHVVVLEMCARGWTFGYGRDAEAKEVSSVCLACI